MSDVVMVLESTSPPAKGLAAKDLAAEELPAESVDGERSSGDEAPLQGEGASRTEGRVELANGPPEEGAGGGSALGRDGGSETGAGGEEEVAPTSRVKVHLRKALGSVDRAAISRVIAEAAKTCHRRELREDPRSAGRLELDFTLIGDTKGPKRLKIGGEEELPKLASCLRKGMGQQRWPTGHLDGVGIFEARVDLSVDVD